VVDRSERIRSREAIMEWILGEARPIDPGGDG
jgi:hypothetical protein